MVSADAMFIVFNMFVATGFILSENKGSVYAAVIVLEIIYLIGFIILCYT